MFPTLFYSGLIIKGVSMIRSAFLAASALVALSGPFPAVHAQTNTETIEEDAQADIDTLFDEYDAAQLSLSPLGKAYRGIKDADYGNWNDPS